jgi:hypothetical protein
MVSCEGLGKLWLLPIVINMLFEHLYEERKTTYVKMLECKRKLPITIHMLC